MLAAAASTATRSPGAGAGGGCPVPAVLAVITLPAVCSHASFYKSQPAFVAALAAVAGQGAPTGQKRKAVGGLVDSRHTFMCYIWIRARVQACIDARSPSRPAPHPPLHHPAGAQVRPRALEVRERHSGQPGAARAVHVAVLFPGAAGWQAARAFRDCLLGDASRLFSARAFGAVYVQAVSAPYLVRTWRACAPAWQPAWSARRVPPGAPPGAHHPATLA